MAAQWPLRGGLLRPPWLHPGQLLRLAAAAAPAPPPHPPFLAVHVVPDEDTGHSTALELVLTRGRRLRVPVSF
jgi:hypothetical protein